MPTSKANYPASYADLVRKNVPLPDSSYRPSTAEVAAAEARRPGPRITTDAEMTSVRAALMNIEGADISDVELDIDTGRATLDGSVALEEDRRRIIAAVEMIPGVNAIVDRLRVRL
jgi:osmotically-inducible protein OsmY